MTEPSKAVFLSYASGDAEAAERICQALQAHGIEAWIDQSELRGGDAWDREIRKRIQDCALFVPIISTHSDGRTEGYFRLEWKLAVDRSYLMADDATFLLPVIIDDTPDAAARVPDKFRTVQWSRLPAGTVAPTFIDRVSRLLSLVQAPAQPMRRPVAAVPTRVLSDAGIAASTWKRAALPLIAAVAILNGGYFALGKFRSSNLTPVPVSAPVTHLVHPTPSAIRENSIAVLPFVDMSEKRDQEYFSDGLSEELIDQLSQNAHLKVIARTSSFQFKSKNEDMRAIAQQLGVTNLLEGSVRKSGSQLRITAQLINASDGTHLWSQTYDRKLDDVFKIQSEIAKKVAESLQVALSSPPPLALNTATTSPEAHNLYLQALYIYRTANTTLDFEATADYLERALKTDPRFPAAWARLSRVRYKQAERSVNEPAAAAAFRDAAKRAAQQALRLDPNLPDAHTAMAIILMTENWDFAGGKEHVLQALALDVNDSLALAQASALASINGQAELANEFIARALRVDPANFYRWQDLFLVRYFGGDYDGAMEALQRLLELNPNYADQHVFRASLLLAKGQPENALAEIDKGATKSNRLQYSALAYQALGRREQADAALASLIRDNSGSEAYGIARIYADRNEVDKSFEWLSRAYRQNDDDLQYLKVDPLLKSIRADFRYNALLQSMRLVEMHQSMPQATRVLPRGRAAVNT